MKFAPSNPANQAAPAHEGGHKNGLENGLENGTVGFEVLPFLVLVFVVGTLVFAQAWAVLDAKMATTSGARQAARTFVEQPGKNSLKAARSNAVRAGVAAVAAARLPGTSRVEPIGSLSLKRCAQVTFEASHEVPALRLGWRSNSAPTTVRSQHSEVVDPFRSGLSGRANCARAV